MGASQVLLMLNLLFREFHRGANETMYLNNATHSYSIKQTTEMGVVSVSQKGTFGERNLLA